MKRTSLIVLCALWALACQKKDVLSGAPPVAEITPLQVACDTCHYPLVMAHGFLASGDTYAPFFQLFHSNGYRAGLIHPFDWNSLNQTANHVQALDQFIDEVLALTGQPKVRLMGHSAGGGLAYNYLSDPARAAKVDAYVHIGSSVQPGPAGPNGSVPTLNLWSPDDAVATGGDINGATNAQIPGKDHYQIATSKESFAAVYAFFHGTPPPSPDVKPQGPLVCVNGKVLTFGENTPLVNAKVEIYEVSPADGQRVSDTPVETLFSNAKGFWGPVNIKANTTYEYVTTSANASDRVIHYFRGGLNHWNLMVYLRTIPPPPSLAGILLSSLPKNSSQSVLNVFSASQAVVNGRDTLTVDGSLLSTAQFAPASKTAITYFLYDDGDSNTELSPVGLFGNFAFLNGVDMFFPTAVPTSIPIRLNERTLQVRNIKSSEGVVVAVFD
jgi:hypothetical protein